MFAAFAHHPSARNTRGGASMIEFLQTLWELSPAWIVKLIPAFVTTLLLTASSFALAVVLAVIIELVRTNAGAAVRSALEIYVDIVRSLPILALLYLIYFGLPGLGISLSAFVSGTIGLAVIYSTYVAEVLRGGVEALHRGQKEAGLAVGLTPLAVFRFIVLPQAVRTVTPPLLTTLISLLKDTSICALIAVNELMLTAKVIMSQTFLPLHVFVLVGVIYFLVSWPLSLFVRWLEPRLHAGRTVNS
jgi:His/Glu/Gln/Arg/opine family amino acid ABC transporter permease subunit